MPEPAGLSIGCPITGQLVTGIVRLFVAKTLKLAPVALVKLKWKAPPPADMMTDPNCGGVTTSVVKFASTFVTKPAKLVATIW